MKINVYVNWKSMQVMSGAEALVYLAKCADDYSKNDGYFGDWLDENYTHTELWYMSDESRAEAEKNFQEACMEWAREDFERTWDRREIEI